MTGDALKSNYINKFNAIGENRFYKFLLSCAIDKLIKIKEDEYKGISTPDVEFLEISDKFLCLYRRDDQEVYLEIARIFRKAAHKIYRLCLKKGFSKKNNKFLNLVH